MKATNDRYIESRSAATGQHQFTELPESANISQSLLRFNLTIDR